METVPAATPNGGAQVLPAEAQAKFAANTAAELPATEKMKELFARFDYNKNKHLSLAEIDKAVREIMPQYADDKQAMMRAYKSADVGKNGFVEFKEFVDLLILLKYYNEIGVLFKAMNVDNDSRITLDEFQKLHKVAGFDIPEDQVKFEFEKLGMGGPSILYEEFTTYMAKRAAAPALAKSAAEAHEQEAAAAKSPVAKKPAAKAAGKAAAKASPAKASPAKASPVRVAAKSPAKSPAKPSPVRGSPKKPAGLRSTVTPGGKDAADRTTTGPKEALTEEDKKRGDACYDRLTNPKNFHGIYRERFKEKGLIEGEEPTSPTKKAGAKPAGMRSTFTPGGKDAADRTTTAKTALSEEDKKRGDACYDRLTNPKNFHGIYKERFKEKGLIEGEQPAVPAAAGKPKAGMRSTFTPGGKDAADRTTTAKTALSEEDKKRGDACYDRLTNPKNFHGIYKERFKEKGLLDEGEEAKSPTRSPVKAGAKASPTRSPVKKAAAKASPKKAAAAAAAVKAGAKPKPIVKPAAAEPEAEAAAEAEVEAPSSPAPTSAPASPAVASSPVPATAASPAPAVAAPEQEAPPEEEEVF